MAAISFVVGSWVSTSDSLDELSLPLSVPGVEMNVGKTSYTFDGYWVQNRYNVFLDYRLSFLNNQLIRFALSCTK